MARAEDLVELKSIKSVQRLAEQIPKRPAPKALLDSDAAHRSHSGPTLAAWLEQYQSDKQWAKTSQVDKVRLSLSLCVVIEHGSSC